MPATVPQLKALLELILYAFADYRNAMKNIQEPFLFNLAEVVEYRNRLLFWITTLQLGIKLG